MTTHVYAPGSYRFIPGVFQYSAGVAAQPGFRLTHVRLREPLPLAQGIKRVEEIIAAAKRPLTAFAACELRSPAPFTEAGFKSFNELYVGTLARWGVYDGRTNPVARSNVCPTIDPPAEPSLYAFSFTEPDANAAPSFVVAGSGEAEEGHANYRNHIVRLGDVSPSGLREKARFVLAEMERRMTALGFAWNDTSAVQLYTVHDIHSFVAEEIVRRGAARDGLIWHYCRPPVVDIEYEMDCRGVALERVL